MASTRRRSKTTGTTGKSSVVGGGEGGIGKNGLLVLTPGPHLQDKIDALHGNESVRILKFTTANGMYDETPISLVDILLPNLQEFHAINVNLQKLTLTKELTPQLETIVLQNPSNDEEPDFVMECPELKRFSLYFWGPGEGTWLLKLLEKATKLEEFVCEQVMVDYLKLASNALQTIVIHRGDGLSALEIWAPKLTMLELRSCHELYDIHFLQDHPLKKELPEGFKFTKPLLVLAPNSLLGEMALDAITNHPRVSAAIAKRVRKDGTSSSSDGIGW